MSQDKFILHSEGLFVRLAVVANERDFEYADRLYKRVGEILDEHKEQNKASGTINYVAANKRLSEILKNEFGI